MQVNYWEDANPEVAEPYINAMETILQTLGEFLGRLIRLPGLTIWLSSTARHFRASVGDWPCRSIPRARRWG